VDGDKGGFGQVEAKDGVEQEVPLGGDGHEETGRPAGDGQERGSEKSGEGTEVDGGKPDSTFAAGPVAVELAAQITVDWGEHKAVLGLGDEAFLDVPEEPVDELQQVDPSCKAPEGSQVMEQPAAPPTEGLPRLGNPIQSALGAQPEPSNTEPLPELSDAIQSALAQQPE
jgi:hypothetical protein